MCNPTCESCFKSDDYCLECSTCHSCLEADQDRVADSYKKQIAQAEKRVSNLVEVAKAMREWIDSVPDDIDLPVMPGFDRDWADSVIDGLDG